MSKILYNKTQLFRAAGASRSPFDAQNKAISHRHVVVCHGHVRHVTVKSQSGTTVLLFLAGKKFGYLDIYNLLFPFAFFFLT